MGAEKLNIEKRISTTRQEYSFWRMNLESDECGEPRGGSSGEGVSPEMKEKAREKIYIFKPTPLKITVTFHFHIVL